jgi:RNA polymerase sigma factor (sigma-70 family)
VARNKIIDRYRKKKPVSLEDQSKNFGIVNDDEPMFLADLLPDPSSNVSDGYDESIIWSAFEDALDELPKDQREVFVWHELDGKSFNEISEMTGDSVNTLLSRKRYAVLHLRKRLQSLYDEMFL